MKKFESLPGFFGFCARRGLVRDHPTVSTGRIVAKHVPTDYFTPDEYARILSYRPDEVVRVLTPVPTPTVEALSRTSHST
jgi:hypothetical protein